MLHYRNICTYRSKSLQNLTLLMQSQFLWLYVRLNGNIGDMA